MIELAEDGYGYTKLAADQNKEATGKWKN